MFKFSEFILEASRGPMLYKVSFIYKGEKFNFESNTMRDTFCKVCDWLYDNGFDFSSISMSIDEMNEKILKTTYTLNHFHNLSNSGNIIQIHINNSKLPIYLINRLKKFLTVLNVTDIQSEGFELYDKNKKYTEEEVEEIPNVYCVRGGRGNTDSGVFLDGDFVGIDYGTKGFDLSNKTKEEIIQFLSSKSESKRAIQQYIQQIELFKNIQEGDIILVPDNEGTNVGEVISDIYLSDEDIYPNRINIEWIDKIEKNS